jgi:hypothetical protein
VCVCVRVQSKRDNNGFNMYMLSNGQMNVNLQQVSMVKGPMRVRTVATLTRTYTHANSPCVVCEHRPLPAASTSR